MLDFLGGVLRFEIQTIYKKIYHYLLKHLIHRMGIILSWPLLTLPDLMVEEPG